MRRLFLACLIAGCAGSSPAAGDDAPGDWRAAISGELCPAPTAPAVEVPIDDVAWNGTDYVVAWTRSWGPSAPDDGEFSDVIAARVSPEGEVRETYGIPITSSPARQIGGKLAAAPDGETLIAFWDGPYLGQNKPLRVARFTPDGTVLDPDGVVIGDGELIAALEYAGDSWLVVWTHALPDFGRELRAARLSRDLEILDPGGVLLTTGYLGPGSDEEVAVATDGTDFLVAWSEQAGMYNQDIVGAFLRGAGDLGDPEPIVISADARPEYVPSTVYDGSRYLVVWTVNNGLERPYSLGMVTVSSGGVVGEPTVPTKRVKPEARTWLAHSGGITALFYDHGGVKMKRYDADLTDLDPEEIPIGDGGWARAAASDDGFLVAWSFGETDAARVALDGTVLDPDGIRVISAAASQSASAITGWSEGQGPVLVWREAIAPERLAARLNSDGAVLDPAGIVLAHTAGIRDPAVARTGDDAVAVLEGVHGVEAIRIRPDGSLLDPVAIAGAGDPELDCSDSECLVAWSGGELWNEEMRVASVGPDGTVTAGDVAIGRSGTSRPDVARHADGYLVTWEQRDRQDAESAVILLARVTSDGVPLDPDGVVVVSGELEYSTDPRIAVSGSTAALVWTIGGELRALLIDPETAAPVGDEIRLGAGGGAAMGGGFNRAQHDVIGHPAGFLVVWERQGGLVGRRLSVDGAEIDDEPFSIAEGGSEPALAIGADGQIAVSYTLYLPDPPYLSNRVRARFVGEGAIEPGTASCQ